MTSGSGTTFPQEGQLHDSQRVPGIARGPSVAIVADHAIGGDHLTRILDGICAQRGTPAVIRTDNGPEFTGKAMLNWAHRRGIALWLIEPDKPNQNAYVESFNGRLRDECLNVMRFMSLDDAPAEIEAWRVDYDERRPHSSLGHLTPSEFVRNRQENRARKSAEL